MIQTEAFYPSFCNSAICLYNKNGDNYILSDATIKNFKKWFISICSVMSRVKIELWYIYTYYNEEIRYHSICSITNISISIDQRLL